ncbi:MAG: hypothetical protein Q4D27_07090, partial [Coriobacteriia bacterium]|nr:hypothetical protein [Coriobacteriia bacterium]
MSGHLLSGHIRFGLRCEDPCCAHGVIDALYCCWLAVVGILALALAIAVVCPLTGYAADSVEALAETACEEVAASPTGEDALPVADAQDSGSADEAPGSPSQGVGEDGNGEVECMAPRASTDDSSVTSDSEDAGSPSAEGNDYDAGDSEETPAEAA